MDKQNFPLPDLPLHANLQTLKEITEKLSMQVPDRHLKSKVKKNTTLWFIPWYYVQQYLDLHAPGWCSFVQLAPFGAKVSATVTIAIPTSDFGWVMRTDTGCEDEEDIAYGDPTSNATQQAFKRAAARFGLGLYLYIK